MAQGDSEKKPAARFAERMKGLLKRPVSDRLVEKINETFQKDEAKKEDGRKDKDKLVAKRRPREVDL